MKSLTRLFTLCGVVVALVCLSGVLFADPEGEDVGATIIREFGCVIIPADWGGAASLFTNETHSVETPSGNTKLTCHFDIPAGLEPATDLIFKGFNCGTFLGLTTNSQSVVSTEGRILLRCMIKANQ